jgi:hypothetical protein
MTVQEDGTIKKENMSQPACKQRSFVKNFETYIEYAKEELHRMQGSENAALSNLGRRLTILQTQCIFP